MTSKTPKKDSFVKAMYENLKRDAIVVMNKGEYVAAATMFHVGRERYGKQDPEFEALEQEALSLYDQEQQGSGGNTAGGNAAAGNRSGGNKSGGNTAGGDGNAPDKDALPVLTPVTIKDDVLPLTQLRGVYNLKRRIVKRFIMPLQYHSIPQSKSLLMYGPPGTGKTLTVGSIVKEYKAQYPEGKFFLFSANSADIKGKYVGQTEKNLTNYFTTAQAMVDAARKVNAQVISKAFIFIDEIESIASNRDAGDVMASSVVALLTLLQPVTDTYTDVLLWGSTNKPWNLDPAILRRFSGREFLDLPKYPAMLQMARDFFRKEFECDEDDDDDVEGMAEKIAKHCSFSPQGKVRLSEELQKPLVMYQEKLGEFLKDIIPDKTAHNAYGVSASDLNNILLTVQSLAGASLLEKWNEDENCFPIKPDTCYDAEPHVPSPGAGNCEDPECAAPENGTVQDKLSFHLVTEEILLKAVESYSSTVNQEDYVDYVIYAISDKAPADKKSRA